MNHINIVVGHLYRHGHDIIYETNITHTCTLVTKTKVQTDTQTRGEVSLKSTCDVNLLSKLSIIFKEWRVVNNMHRGGARV
jgi:hypothetical protein